MTDEDDPSSVPDVGALVAELRAKVEERQRQGRYPAELEEDLHEHFRRVTRHRVGPDLDALRHQIEQLDRVGSFTPGRIPLESGMPGGAVFHRTVAKVVSRQTQGILEQMQEFSDAVRAALRLVLAGIEGPHAHVHADLVGQVDALLERMAAFERGPTAADASVVPLRARLEALEAVEATRHFDPFFDNDRFEEEFRGTREELLARYRDLGAQLEGFGPVLDVGCGRGEFLEILTELGLECRGVDIDPALVEECRGRGLMAEQADGLVYLARQADGSLGAVSLIQVVEHMTPQQAVDFVLLVRDKLRPGGRAVVETVNPQSLYVFAHAFYLDPTHTQPVHPAYLRFLFQEAGFGDVRIEWRSEPPERDLLHEVPADDELGKAVNENTNRLNRLLFAPQDYAIIATR